ncbi:MAG: hypothetical protein KAJ79_05610 [Candidatus Omnitrophica bacterium]|nr:hypothetical protein [Candidatus Omnitrophota bacterium]MCK5288521.1 hypothetical protein [Candidatus Omnitrophota bacterium]
MFLLRIIFFYFIFSFAFKLISYFLRLGKSSYSINKENKKSNKHPFDFKNVVDADFKDNDDEEE